MHRASSQIYKMWIFSTVRASVAPPDATSWISLHQTQEQTVAPSDVNKVIAPAPCGTSGHCGLYWAPWRGLRTASELPPVYHAWNVLRYQFSNQVDSLTLLKLIVGSKEDLPSSNICPNNISASAMTSIRLWGATWAKLGELGGTATIMFEFSQWSSTGSFNPDTFSLSSAVTWFHIWKVVHMWHMHGRCVLKWLCAHRLENATVSKTLITPTPNTTHTNPQSSWGDIMR